jgi:hypothetical protein
MANLTTFANFHLIVPTYHDCPQQAMRQQPIFLDHDLANTHERHFYARSARNIPLEMLVSAFSVTQSCGASAVLCTLATFTHHGQSTSHS